jgi:hypothetical protein
MSKSSTKRKDRVRSINTACRHREVEERKPKLRVARMRSRKPRPERSERRKKVVKLQYICAKGTSGFVSHSVSYRTASRLGCRASRRLVVELPVISLNPKQTYKLQSQERLTSWYPLYTDATAVYIQHIFQATILAVRRRHNAIDGVFRIG